jgi:hypothetical protein
MGKSLWAKPEAVSPGGPHLGEKDFRKKAGQFLFGAMSLDDLMAQCDNDEMTLSRLQAEQQKNDEELKEIASKLAGRAGEAGEETEVLIVRQAYLTRRAGVIEASINNRTHPDCR